MFYLTIAILNFIFYHHFLSQKSFSVTKSARFKYGFALISVILATAQIMFIYHIKGDNLYQIHDRPRITFDMSNKTRAEREEYDRINRADRPLVTKSDMEEFILNHTEYQLFYDKYGDTFLLALKELQSWKVAGIFVLEKSIFETIGFYFGSFLISLYFYKNYPHSRLKQCLGLLMMICFLIELDLYMELMHTNPYVDYFWPDMTTFERIIFAKIIFVCCMNISIAYYCYVKKPKYAEIEDLLKTVIEENQKLCTPALKRVRGRNDQLSKSESTQLLNSMEPSIQIIKAYVENKKKFMQNYQNSKKIFLYLLVTFVIFNVIYTLPITQDYLVERFRTNNAHLINAERERA